MLGFVAHEFLKAVSILPKTTAHVAHCAGVTTTLPTTGTPGVTTGSPPPSVPGTTLPPVVGTTKPTTPTGSVVKN